MTLRSQHQHSYVPPSDHNDITHTEFIRSARPAAASGDWRHHTLPVKLQLVPQQRNTHSMEKLLQYLFLDLSIQSRTAPVVPFVDEILLPSVQLTGTKTCAQISKEHLQLSFTARINSISIWRRSYWYGKSWMESTLTKTAALNSCQQLTE